MCNASGHHPGCECGWGGGHTSSTSYGRYLYTKTESYTVPNAKCPECGEAVFFFSSEDGGRVFFDALGPPWPKHPCTDTSHNIKNFNFNFSKNNYRKLKKDFWMPFIVKDYYHRGGRKNLNGIILNNDSDTYVALEIKRESNPNWLEYWSKETLFFIKKVNDSSVISYEISSLIYNQKGNFEEVKISLCYLGGETAI